MVSTIINCNVHVDVLSLKNNKKKISTKVGVSLCNKAKIQTFTTEWLTSRTVPLTIDIYHL